MRSDPEYQLYKAISKYLRLQYQGLLFHYDPTGNKLTKAQAGKLKEIQDGSAWPDLFIAKPNSRYSGLFLELKPEGTKLFKLNGDFVNDHIQEQAKCLSRLRYVGYYSVFGVGFNDTKSKIDYYLSIK